jgi:hypothetical protein
MIYNRQSSRVSPSASSPTPPGGAATPVTLPIGSIDSLVSLDVDAEISQLEELLRKAWGHNQLQTETFVRLLGLQHCRSTVVGGPMLRGLSGGEPPGGCAAAHLVL